jgi:flagellar hook-length control protein FliK
MMSQTNVDFLLQLTAPADRERAGLFYFGVEAPCFDDHLALASETALEAPTKNDVQPTAAGYARPNDHHRLGSAAGPAPASSGESSPTDCAACGEPEPQVADENAQVESPVESDDADADETDAAESNSVGSDRENDDEAQDAEAAGTAPAIAAATNETGAIAGTEATAAEASSPDEAARPPGSTDISPGEAAAKLHAETSQNSAGDAPPDQSTPGIVATGPVATDRIARANGAHVSLAAEASPAGQVASDPSQIRRAADDEAPGESRDETANERRAAIHEPKPPTEPSAGDALKPSAAGRPKPDRIAAAARRAGDRNKSDEPPRGGESPSDRRAQPTATTNQLAAAAIANPAVATPVLAATGNEAANNAATRSKQSASNRDSSLLNAVARANRLQSPAGRAGRAGSANQMPRIDATRFVGRVAKAVQTAHERGGPLQLRLSPPELGSLRLELQVQNGVLTAALETETPAARQVLLDHLPALRERLAEQNIRIERFDVDVRQESSSGQADHRASHQEQPPRQPYDPPSRQSFHRTPSSDNEPPTPVPLPIGSASSGIDVVA